MINDSADHSAVAAESPSRSVVQSLDLTHCDREPIHLAGAIQPHGALVVVTEPELQIVQASANLVSFLGLEDVSLTGLSIGHILGPAQIGALRDQLATSNLDGALRHLLTLPCLPYRTECFHLFGNRVDGLLLLEFERADQVESTLVCGVLSGLQGTMQRLREAPSLREFLNMAVGAIQADSGFDRVLAYRFDPDGSGEVVAEVSAPGLETYLGLHYPASDIPAPARRLFGFSALRHLPDVDYLPVPVLSTLATETPPSPIDLSCSFLRSVSGMYREYLRNMGVQATLVAPIMKEGQPWGLISCMHHQGPKFVPYERRIAIEFLIQLASQMLGDREALDHSVYRAQLDQVLIELSGAMGRNETFSQALIDGTPHLLSVLDAEGAALFADDRLSLLGLTPTAPQVESLLDWLAERDTLLYSTHALVREYPQAAAFQSVASGLLSVRLSRTGSERIIWFRPEVLRDVHWAGDPSKPVEIAGEDQAMQLRPRASFARWKEIVRGQSRPWLADELDYASRLRQAILDILVEHNRQLTQTNAELQRSNATNSVIMAELLANQARLAEAQRRARLGHWEWDMLKDHLFWSDELYKLYGVDPASFAHHHAAFLERVHPQDRALVEQQFTQALLGVPIDFDLRIVRADGEERVLHIVAEARCNAEAQPVLMLGTSQDVTESRKAAEQLRKLSLAVEQTPDSIVITDVQGRIEYVNQAFIQINGYTRDEVLGQNMNILRSGQTPRETYRSLWESLSHGRPWQGEFINKHHDGQIYTVCARVSPIRQPDGFISHFVAVQEDITEKKHLSDELERHRHHLEELVAERTAELRRQSRILQSLIDHLPHPVWLKDRQGRVTAANRALADIYGLTSADLLGKTDHEISPPDLAERYSRADAEVIASGRPLIVEEPAASVPDSLFETYKAPIFDADGTVLGTVGYSRDIKPQRDMEAELARRAREAEIATQAKSLFLANMSHEIRTPLTAIVGFAESLFESGQSIQERIEAINTIIRNGRHLQKLICDILDFSKIEAERLEVELTRISLSGLLSEVHALGMAQARDKKLHFSSHYLLPLPEFIVTDGTRLRQILINLISNAIKFTLSPGDVRLIVSLDAGCRQLMFTIQDTGIGIDQEETARLFEAFTQADLSTTRRFGGTGLGLSIARALARQLGGDIRVISELSLGSLFVVTVDTGPLDGARMMCVGTGAVGTGPQSSTKEARFPSLAGRVLLAEDNPDNQRLVALLVRRTGAELVIANNGQEAVELAQEREYDLVLMDLQMPIMDGVEATQILRLTGFDRPVIALTANATETDKALAIEAGCNEFLTKPIDQAAFFATLAQHLPVAGLQPGKPSVTPSPPELVDDDPEFQALVERFFRELPVQLANIETAYRQQDWPLLRVLTHQLKGVAGSFGLPEATRIAGAIESLILRYDYDPIAHLIAELMNLCPPPS